MMTRPARPESAAPPADAAAERGRGAIEQPHYDLLLYVAGSLPNSVQAQANLRSVCDEYLSDRYTLEVVDFLEAPERALADGVLVTPTLLKRAPEPLRVVVGALSDRATLLHALDLPEVEDGGRRRNP